MSEEDQSNKDHSEFPQGIPNPEAAKPVGTAPQQPATAQQLQDVKREMSAFEGSTLRWAKTAVLVTGVTGLFICLQWCEMRSGSSDTHNLAVATQSLADHATKEDARAEEIKTALQGLDKSFKESVAEGGKQFKKALAEQARISDAQLKQNRELTEKSQAVSIEQQSRGLAAIDTTTHLEQRPRVEFFRATRQPREIDLARPQGTPPRLNVVLSNSGRQAASGLRVAGITCRTGATAAQLFNGPAFPISTQVDPKKDGVPIAAFSLGTAIEVPCPQEGLGGGIFANPLIEIVVYGFFQYSDYSGDLHTTEFCVGGTMEQLQGGIPLKCPHNNNSK